MKTTHLLSGLAAAALALPAWAAPSAISATLNPSHIALGDSALLTVSLHGQQAAAVHVPNVDGVDIAPAGQSTTMQIVNGAVSSSASYQYNVTPRHAGNFTIPAISAGGATAQPIGFRVDPGSGGGSAPSGRSHSALRPTVPNLPNDESTTDAKGQAAFLRITVPKPSLYVGELVPVQLKAYFRAGTSASLEGLPMLSSDAFALGKLGEKPEQTEEMIGGAPYTVLTWDSTLSAVKAGDYPLNIDLPVAVRVRQQGRRGGHNPFKDFFGDDSPFGSMLDDSFFDNFMGQVTEKQVTLHAEGTTMHNLTPPAAGRPAGFSGAVGDFDVSAETTATAATAGDPLTLKIKISGQGNFDRVNTAGLARSAAWKTYKPSAKFEPTDSAGSVGIKTFEQAVIPTNAGPQEIPALDFSYFDPSTGKYVTKHTDPIAINVAAGDPAKVAATAATTDEPNANAPVTTRVHASPIASLHPLILRPWFIFLNATVLVALGLVTLIRAIQRHRPRDPQSLVRETAERAVHLSLEQMDAAVRRGDSPGFFDAARHAVQERLGEHWRLPASEVTNTAITQRLNGHGEEFRALFRTADEAAYCGRRFTPAELQQWRNAIQQQLEHIPEL